jgi:predicted acetyltransferase
MLSDGLDICRRMGLSKVLITCAKENLPSAKTIRSNGGVLDSEDTDNGEIFERYWITL